MYDVLFDFDTAYNKLSKLIQTIDFSSIQKEMSENPWNKMESILKNVLIMHRKKSCM